MKKENTNKKDTKISSDFVLNFPNLLPYLLYEYRTSMLNALKNIFLDNLLECIKVEREYCKNNNLQPLMTQEKIDQITSILDQCTDVYMLQALNNFVFLENTIPTLEEVKRRAYTLRLLYPHIENMKRR